MCSLTDRQGKKNCCAVNSGIHLCFYSWILFVILFSQLDLPLRKSCGLEFTVHLIIKVMIRLENILPWT